MKVDKVSQGVYRVRKQYKCKTYTLYFSHKPSQKEITLALAEKLDCGDNNIKGSFYKKAKEYIEVKSNVLSPSTIGGYEKILRNISDEFKYKSINDIDSVSIQKELNDYSVGRSPKTVKNMYGFISAVFALFRPSFNIKVTLPQAIKYEPYLPKEHEIKAILNSVKGTDYSIPFQLGVLGMRRSEVCAATIDKLNGNFLLIDSAYVYDRQNKPIIKPYTKTTEGRREIYIPDSLVAEIRRKGAIFDKQPHNLVRVLHNKQDELNIPHFRFHDLRHYYASYAHESGMSDADIMASGGWKSDYTMKSIYRHSMEKEKQDKQKKIASEIL